MKRKLNDDENQYPKTKIIWERNNTTFSKEELDKLFLNDDFYEKLFNSDGIIILNFIRKKDDEDHHKYEYDIHINKQQLDEFFRFYEKLKSLDWGVFELNIQKESLKFKALIYYSFKYFYDKEVFDKDIDYIETFIFKEFCGCKQQTKLFRNLINEKYCEIKFIFSYTIYY
jgi:hypothetical protein